MSSGQKDYADEQAAKHLKERAASLRELLDGIRYMKDEDLVSRAEKILSLYHRINAGVMLNVDAASAWATLRTMVGI